MKKYVYEANRTQWEKPNEPKSVFNRTATTTVIAENEKEAEALACRNLRSKYHGTGIILSDMKKVAEFELAVDWNYGYGDERGTGSAEEKEALTRANTY
ncbi:MAG: hypothetical protein IKH56_10680 [Oscillospiraceae bacterium]|nr:hypothetical protein [Oscillospiraceae bacterium]